ncbi:ribosome maturation factor RimM [Helicobacter sp. MIT 14-3879]|uniref:ribosome maturation factor RimM n=1 Tax=Helicobacter sp. MIT 14-3879 TaxID=2040649 RepID=UPI000E1F67EC|nr:ribosome maturation factor RimM [Helicobacter sp. MIT 14-3879]RDU62642.1 16S rRNA processing protein RimM [Helicobacter sp. MIT 14-3879]
MINSSKERYNFNILVAKCGRSIGLKGEIKLIIYTDFLDIFTKGNIFRCGDFKLTLESFNLSKNSAFFKEIRDIDSAKRINSLLLYSDRETSLKYCFLNKDEFFWFDVINLNVFDNNELIGKVLDIERIGNVDYLIIRVDEQIFKKYPYIKARNFYLPYISRYIIDTNLEIKSIFVKDSLSILETS